MRRFSARAGVALTVALAALVCASPASSAADGSGAAAATLVSPLQLVTEAVGSTVDASHGAQRVEAAPMRIRFEPSAADTPFFSQEPFGFDASTLRRVGTAVAQAPGAAVQALRHASPSDWAPALVMLVVALLVAVVADRRVRDFVAAQLVATAPTRDDWEAPWRALLFRLGAALVGPTLVWGALMGPVSGLYPDAQWPRAGTTLAALWLGWASVREAARVVLRDNLFALPAGPARRLWRALLTTAPILLGALTGVAAARTFGAATDVVRLAEETLRVAAFACGAVAFALRRQFVALLPPEGSAGYLRFRRGVERYAAAFLSSSLALLALWGLGFHRAASTLLLRSYGIVALATAGALTLRWFERVTTRPRGDGLVSALVAEVDGFARACIKLAFLGAVLALLGLVGPLVRLLGAIGVSVGDDMLSLLSLLRAGLVAAAAVLVWRVVRVSAERVWFPRLGVDVGMAYAITTAAQYAMVALAAVATLMALGIDLGAVTVFAGALGVGIGFGLQDFARNLLSGLMLLFGRQVEKGDLVTVGDAHTGVIEEIGARAVRIRTRDNTDLLVPASSVTGTSLINWTHGSPVVRVHVPVGVSYGSDVHQVRAALLRAAAQFAGVLRDPEPDVWLVAFGDSSVNFELLVWVDAHALDPRAMVGKLMFFVWDVLKEEGIEIPFPQRDLHIRSVSPAAAASLRSESTR
ncbi:MAG: mechanosensitive ion channel [Myxococcales bacterium]|nr:mechanosensitive ion channel [Myxococcales bacterium]MCB9520991.1 mechanosensitive ion channel [Myxococcales bacterium]MCB9531682.1 mechanosensitive ion channel [Myxococcales bacterium]MCB9534017.1 mechanosensitive ion channel [Myxococcales bacterium]